MSNIQIGNIAQVIAQEMEKYADAVAEDIKTEAKKTAKEAVKELKSTSPEGAGSAKGHYKDGWTSKVTSENSHSVSVQIYNKNKPGLTHLLEKGHAKRGGGRVEGISHIGPVEQAAVESFEKNIRERLTQ